MACNCMKSCNKCCNNNCKKCCNNNWCNPCCNNGWSSCSNCNSSQNNFSQNNVSQTAEYICQNSASNAFDYANILTDCPAASYSYSTTSDFPATPYYNFNDYYYGIPACLNSQTAEYYYNRIY